MRITILSVGKLKERYWREAVEEYLKRLSAYADVRMVEISDRDSGRLGDDKAREAEGIDLLKAIPEGAHVITLEIDGRQRSSENLAQHMANLALSGNSHVAFVIGGSVGLSEAVRKRAQEALSFGAITLPHNLAQVVLVEQVYRAFRIQRNEPYHK